MSQIAELNGVKDQSRNIIPEVVIGDHSYFTADSISDAFGLARYHIVNAVRAGQLHGRKLGTQYVLDANEFNEWIRSGAFEKQTYTKRVRQTA